jgi:hypothetical protein
MYLLVRRELSCICLLDMNGHVFSVRRERSCICVLDMSGHVFVC